MTIEEIRNELSCLTTWFDIDYTRKEQKYNRLIALGKVEDEGENVADKLLNLYNEAEIKRNRIKLLEEMMKEKENATETK